MRIALFRAVLLVISLGLALLVGEFLVGWLAPQPASWLPIYRSHPELPFFSMLPDVTLSVDTGETEWTVATDAEGFRRSVREPAQGACAALWLGDSFTFGHGVEYEESFVGQIDAGTPGVRHLNAAVAGYGPAQYRGTLEYLGSRGVEFDRIFVASYVGNDFHDTQWNKDSIVVDGIIGNRGNLKSLLKRRFHIYRLLSATYHSVAIGEPGVYDAIFEQLESPAAWREPFLSEARERYALEMQAIQRYADTAGKPVAFLILPTRDAVEHARATGSQASDTDRDTEGREPMLPIRRALAILDEIGARAVDLTPAVAAAPPDEMFFRFDGHLTPPANRRVADAILERFDLRCDAVGSAEPES